MSRLGSSGSGFSGGDRGGGGGGAPSNRRQPSHTSTTTSSSSARGSQREYTLRLESPTRPARNAIGKRPLFSGDADEEEEDDRRTKRLSPADDRKSLSLFLGLLLLSIHPYYIDRPCDPACVYVCMYVYMYVCMYVQPRMS